MHFLACMKWVFISNLTQLDFLVLSGLFFKISYRVRNEHHSCQKAMKTNNFFITSEQYGNIFGELFHV